MTDGSRTLKIARSDAANINWSNRVREHTNLLDEPLKQIGIHICEIYDTIAYFARCSRFTFWHGIWGPHYPAGTHHTWPQNRLIESAEPAGDL